MKTKRVLVAGVGAIGATVAARLQGQAQVVGLDTNAAHARRISEAGLAVEGATRLRVVFNCVMDPGPGAGLPHRHRPGQGARIRGAAPAARGRHCRLRRKAGTPLPAGDSQANNNRAD